MGVKELKEGNEGTIKSNTDGRKEAEKAIELPIGVASWPK
jgi:hypothetical protein